MTAEGRRRALIAWVATVAFAAFCAFHWANLLKAPPVGKILLIVAIAAALGLGLLTIAARAQTPERARAGAAALTLVAVVAGLLAAGIELRLFTPAHWDALGGGIGDGIAGLGGATYPYDEDARWANLVLLAALPVILVAAFAFCFWPVRKARWTRGVGLGILVGAYGLASVLYAPGLPLLHGILLLALLASCLWAPELRTSRLALAAGAVALAALVAVPVAGALDRERPVVDYRSWDWTGGEPSVGFAWNHAYGPLDWPREGTALLEVRSPEAHYWRSIVLERFDGFRWVRSDIASRPMELPNLIEGSEGGDLRDDWYETTEVTVRELRSGLVVSPGSPQSVDGIEETIAGDGTTLAGELPASGQSYEVVSYAPDPSTEELKSAPGEYDPALARFTQLDLPTSRVELPGNLDLPQLETGATNLITETLHVPLWGEPSPALAVAARESGYGDVYALAQRLRRESSTPYEFVRAVERHLGQGFSYSESPAQSRRPLRSFLFAGADRVLPAVLRRDGADPADGRHPHARRLRLQPGGPGPGRGWRVRGPRHRRPLVGRDLLLGHRLGPVRPDPVGVPGQLPVGQHRRRRDAGRDLRAARCARAGTGDLRRGRGRRGCVRRGWIAVAGHRPAPARGGARRARRKRHRPSPALPAAAPAGASCGSGG